MSFVIPIFVNGFYNVFDVHTDGTIFVNAPISYMSTMIPIADFITFTIFFFILFIIVWIPSRCQLPTTKVVGLHFNLIDPFGSKQSAIGWLTTAL